MDSINDPFPAYMDQLSDNRWVHEIAGFIVSDLPRLTEDDRQVVYENLIDLRLWTFGRVAA